MYIYCINYQKTLNTIAFGQPYVMWTIPIYWEMEWISSLFQYTIFAEIMKMSPTALFVMASLYASWKQW